MKRIMVLVLCLALMAFCCACSKEEPVELRQYADADVSADVKTQEPEEEEVVGVCPPAVMIKGELYYDTGNGPDFEITCGTMDGMIDSSVPQNEMPTKDNQSNFGEGFGYQLGLEGSYNVMLDDGWHKFAIK